MGTDLPNPSNKRPLRARVIAVTVILSLTLVLVVAYIAHQGIPSRTGLSSMYPSSGNDLSTAKAGQSGLYATAINGIYRLDVKDGHLKLIWHYKMKALRDQPSGNAVGASDRVNTAVTVAGDVAYFGGNDGAGNYSLYALSTTDGSLHWSAKIGLLTVAPVVAQGVIYVGEENDIFALNVRDGSVRWRYHFPTAERDYFGGMGAVADGRVYVGSANRIFALDATTGGLLWSRVVEHGQAFIPPEVIDGVLYDASLTTCSNCAVQPFSSVEYAYNPANGVLLWRTAKLAGFPSLPAVTGGVAYVGSQDGSLSALRTKDGIRLWRVKVGGSIRSMPQVVNRVVYVGAARSADVLTNPNVDHGHILALDAAHGSFHWSYRVPDPSYDGSEPLIVAGGVVYVATGLAFIDTARANDGVQIQQYVLRKFDRLSRDPGLTLVP